MARGRSNIEINMTILKVVCVPSRLAKIMSEAHVNALTLKPRLAEFEKIGWVKSQTIPFAHVKLSERLARFHAYSLTDEGVGLIKAWDSMLLEFPEYFVSVFPEHCASVS